MTTIVALLSLVALSQGATLVPVDTSVVNVKSEHSGQDYSYTIQENRGYAINPAGGVHPVIPAIKAVPQYGTGVIHGQEHMHVEGHRPERHEAAVKAVPEHVVPEHGIPVGVYPATHLNYVPVSYQYGFPYSYAYPYNILTYRVA